MFELYSPWFNFVFHLFCRIACVSLCHTVEKVISPCFSHEMEIKHTYFDPSFHSLIYLLEWHHHITIQYLPKAHLLYCEAACGMIVITMVTPVTYVMCFYKSQTRMSPEVIPPWMDATHPRVEDLLLTERYNI